MSLRDRKVSHEVANIKNTLSNMFGKNGSQSLMYVVNFKVKPNIPLKHMPVNR